MVGSCSKTVSNLLNLNYLKECSTDFITPLKLKAQWPPLSLKGGHSSPTLEPTNTPLRYSIERHSKAKPILLSLSPYNGEVSMKLIPLLTA